VSPPAMRPTTATPSLLCPDMLLIVSTATSHHNHHAASKDKPQFPDVRLCVLAKSPTAAYLSP
jgi:hypothetical protein